MQVNLVRSCVASFPFFCLAAELLGGKFDYISVTPYELVDFVALMKQLSVSPFFGEQTCIVSISIKVSIKCLTCFSVPSTSPCFTDHVLSM
jgi:hypothetical protein